jgi:hypothetical protein
MTDQIYQLPPRNLSRAILHPVAVQRATAGTRTLTERAS